jgi:hypothetical protein
MSDTPDPRDAIDTAAALFEIPLQPEWREVAAASFATVAAAARLVADFPLEDEAEFAPVFRA